jgi:hypothetical protein
MFIDFWPLIQEYIPDRDERVDFTADLLKILVKGDMDPWAVEDLDADVRAALLRANIGVAESEKYNDTARRTEADATPMPNDRIRELRSQGSKFSLFSLKPFLAYYSRQSDQDRCRLIALVLVHFLQDHGLTTRTILPADDAISAEFVIRVGDLTDSGLALHCTATDRWLRATDHGTSPTDTTILVDALASLQRRDAR